MQPKQETVNKQTTNKFAKLKRQFLLDTGSTIKGTVSNPDMANNIRVAETPLHMKTNAGSKTLNLECDIEGFGTAYFDPEQLANILGFADLADRYRITYDNAIEDAFFMHTEFGILKFDRDYKLYAFTPSDAFFEDVAKAKQMEPPSADAIVATTDATPQVSYLVSTVNENMKGFTKRQIDRAR